jgi:histone-lysine N-methyltransferase ASH1L
MDTDDASEQLAASTPPTSVDDNGSITHEHASGGGGRARRSRVAVNYNVKELLDAQASEELIGATSAKPRKASGLSGRTLVDHRNETDLDVADSQHIEMELDDDLEKMLARSPKGKGTATATATKAEGRTGLMGRAKNAASVLGKRTRDVYEAGKKTLGMVEERSRTKKSKLLRELETGPGGILDDIDLDAATEPQPPPPKRARTTTRSTNAPPKPLAPARIADPMQKTASGVAFKKWQSHGLYAGMRQDFDASKLSKPTKLRKNNSESSESASLGENGAQPNKKHLNFALPMFGYLDRERSFTIPYDIYAPTMDKDMFQKPPKFTLVTQNRAIGDAKALWKDKQPDIVSYCTCLPDPGCDESCLNAIMGYECDQSNCRLEPENCTNRPFHELALRGKRGTAYDVGVEVIKTKDRGHGVRAARQFEPGRIIMEYTGEIITQHECQTRLATTYKDDTCHYVMEMENGLVLDGKKGSIARFINHSCAPNCEVKMTRVGQVSRIGVYAGQGGIMTGEELSYDYNFETFGGYTCACYCGSQHCRGYLGKRLPES